MAKKAILKCPFKQEMYASGALIATFHALSALKMPLGAQPFQNLSSNTDIPDGLIHTLVS